MELEQLRSVFFKKVEITSNARSVEELAFMLKRRASSPVSRLKRSLRFELVTAILFLGFPAYILTKYESVYIQSFAALLVITILALLFKLVSLHRRLVVYQQSSFPVWENLTQLVLIFRKFSGLYLLSTMLLIPVFFLSGFLMVYYQNQTLDPLLFSFELEREKWIYLVGFFAWWICMYFFTKWYVRKLYGKYVARLEQLLNELAD